MSAAAMPGTGAGPAPIPVTVYHEDPLIHAGLTCLLRSSPLVDVRDGEDPAAVTVLFAERVGRLVLTALRRLSRTGRVVLVVARLDEQQLLRALDSGVSAIVLRHQITRERLVGAVRAAARDDPDLPSDAVGHLVDALVRARRETPGREETAEPPTDRELDVLRLLADGLETREIAGRLAVSERTVKNVLHGVTVRFQLRNRTHAVAHALREGYL
ncbi:response regulator transcription factor [Actinoplanes sp. NPDC020271]|uniref:response regulator transcription factor n=1 Tax=Actinoplanes sp. NPDC020271 TaxID=3363896 RepID=UPI0037A2B65F